MNFLKKLEKYKSNVCLIDENEKIFFYKDILNRSKEINQNLSSRSLVFVLSDNSADCITSYISFFRKGLVQALISSNIEKNILDELIISYAPTYIFLSNSRCKDFPNSEVIFKFDYHKILLINKSNSYKIHKDLALLLSTSGSTGSKKFTRISYENIYDNTKNIIKYLKINKSHRTITTMQPYYSYGLSILNTHLFAGASIVITKASFMEKSFWNLMNNQKITSFGGVPYMYEILKKLKFYEMKLPFLKYFTQAGGHLSENLFKIFLEYSKKEKKKFIIMYGQTEASPRMTYLPYDMATLKAGSIGIPIPGGKIFLKNKNKKIKKKGEIIYKGKNVSMGYANNKNDLKKNDTNKGILATGDLAIKDKDKYLYIIGRKSRDIKLFGHRVNLNELENILTKKGYNCICHGVENKITIFYTNLNYDNKIINYLSYVTKINKNSIKMKLLKSFPYSENGKISYKNLDHLL